MGYVCAVMSSYFLAVLLLSGAAFIHTKSSAPELRPRSRRADSVWRALGKGALVAWVALLAWGFLTLHWSRPLAALLGSLALNALIASRGPRPAWPGLSMLFAVVGLGLGVYAVWG